MGTEERPHIGTEEGPHIGTEEISSTCTVCYWCRACTCFSHFDTTGATLIRSIFGTHMYMYKDSNNTCMHVHVCGCQQTYHQGLLSVNIPPPTQPKLRQRCHHAQNSLSVKLIGRASCFHMLMWL